MKKLGLIIFMISLVNFSQAQEKIHIDIEKSSLKWMGEYTFYFGGHEGFISFSEGYLIKTNDRITGGSFIVDMNSMTNTDIESEDGKKGLVDHLKSDDFFSVDKFPIAKLVITKVDYSEEKYIRVEADLTIKNITKPINFIAQFDAMKNEAQAKFRIDRTLWDVTYNNVIKNEAISDAIGFEVKLFY